MATADSIIRVAIVADAKKLASGFKDADKATGGFLGSAAKVAGAALAIKGSFDFVDDALNESDRLGDAFGNLAFQIGEADAQKLADMADDFANIGQSAQDMLELEAAFAGIGAAIGLTKGDIATYADDVAATAAAMALVDDEGRPAAFWVDQIAKAAGGAAKPLKDLGIGLDEGAVAARAMADTGKDNAGALTESDLAAARLKIILEKLRPKLDDATTGTADLEQKQSELQAKFETLQGQIGTALEGPLTDLLTWIGDMIDAIPGAIEGWQLLGGAIEGFGRTVLGPLGNVRDVLDGILGALGRIDQAPMPSAARFTGSEPRSERTTVSNTTRVNERSGLRDRIGGP